MLSARRVGERSERPARQLDMQARRTLAKASSKAGSSARRSHQRTLA
jgi:hypothetical protein